MNHSLSHHPNEVPKEIQETCESFSAVSEEGEILFNKKEGGKIKGKGWKEKQYKACISVSQNMKDFCLILFQCSGLSVAALK